MKKVNELKVDDLSYEEAYAQLEQIVNELEGGELGLDQSLHLFKTGIDLSRVCNQRLNEAEAKIEKLVKQADGSLKRENFVVDEDPEEINNGQLPF